MRLDWDLNDLRCSSSEDQLELFCLDEFKFEFTKKELVDNNLRDLAKFVIAQLCKSTTVER